MYNASRSSTLVHACTRSYTLIQARLTSITFVSKGTEVENWLFYIERDELHALYLIVLFH